MTYQLTLFFAGLACVQAATVSGTVADVSGAVIPDATITLHKTTGSLSLNVSSDKGGHFSFEQVSAGEYLLEASASGLSLGQAQTLQLRESDHKQVSLQLAVAAIRTLVSVTSSGSAQTPDQVSKALDVVYSDEAQSRGLFSAADALRFIEPQVAVKGDEHPLHLRKERLGRRRLAEPIEQDRVAFDLGDFEAELVGVDQLFQQLRDNVTAVADRRLVHELREAADVGYEEQPALGGVGNRLRHELLSSRADEIRCVGILAERRRLAVTKGIGMRPLGRELPSGALRCPGVRAERDYHLPLGNELTRLEALEVPRLGNLLEEASDFRFALATGSRRQFLGAEGLPVDVLGKIAEHRINVTATKRSVGVLDHLHVLLLVHGFLLA